MSPKKKKNKLSRKKEREPKLDSSYWHEVAMAKEERDKQMDKLLAKQGHSYLSVEDPPGNAPTVPLQPELCLLLLGDCVAKLMEYVPPLPPTPPPRHPQLQRQLDAGVIEIGYLGNFKNIDLSNCPISRIMARHDYKNTRQEV